MRSSVAAHCITPRSLTAWKYVLTQVCLPEHVEVHPLALAVEVFDLAALVVVVESAPGADAIEVAIDAVGEETGGVGAFGTWRSGPDVYRAGVGENRLMKAVAVRAR